MNSLVCILTLLLCPAFCARGDILVPQAGSWISNDNFAILVNLSFPYSTCCNVYLSDFTERSKALFNQFKRIYPYEYLLNRSSYECDGYLLLGSTCEQITRFIKTVQPHWKTEILALIDDRIPNGSNIFDLSLYGIANFHVASLSGIWKLSENYVKPRIFIKIDRYEGMRHNYEIINLRGRELHACSIYKPPMTYLNRTVNRTIDGKQTEVFTVDSDQERDGVEMQLFLIVSEKLNFTWTIKKPSGLYTYGARVNETEWKGGMIQLLRDNKADIAFGSIWVTEDQNTFAHLSQPWHQLYLNFLVPRPRRTTSFWALTRPFSPESWWILVSAVLLHSLYTYTRAWIDPNYPKRYRNFLITLTDLIGCLLSSSVPRTIANNKLQMLLWRTAGWLIIAAYCSSLAARLANSGHEGRIDTIEQFLAANLTWGETGETPPFRDYFDLTDAYSAQLPSRYRYVENDTRAIELIARGDYAIFGKIVDNCFFPEDYVPNEELKNYRLMKQSVGRFYAAFAVQPWLLEPVNRVNSLNIICRMVYATFIILLLRDSGITAWHLRDIIRKRNSYNLREVLVEHDGYDGSVQVLGLMPLGAGFSLLLVGSSIAALAFYLELKRAAGSTSIRELLRRIETERESRNNRVHDKI